jgi:hypothetical protein
MKCSYQSKPVYDDFKTGDIGLTSNNAISGKVIRFFTSWHTSNAVWNHAYIHQNRNVIVEALFKIKATPTSKYYDKNIVVYRIPLTNEERVALEVGLANWVNGAYGFSKLALFALDAVATKVMSKFGRKDPVFFFSKYVGILGVAVCSQVVVKAIHKFTSFRFRDANGAIVSWKIVSPDYLEDLLKLSINRGVKIYEQKIVDSINCPGDTSRVCWGSI